MRNRFYLSTIAPDAPHAAREYGLGLEVAEYCTAANADENFPETDAAVREKLACAPCGILHAPFNELFPCAIDPKARDLAKSRYLQVIRLARRYGAKKVVIHGGYNPWLYYPCWYVEQSVSFWRAFPIPEDMEICLENVLEEEPDMLLDILRGADHPNLKMCLDVGHASAYSRHSPMGWLDVCAPWISHIHLHNNDGRTDLHDPLMQGVIPMGEMVEKISGVCPDATVTLELMTCEESVKWLKEEGRI